MFKLTFKLSYSFSHSLLGIVSNALINLDNKLFLYSYYLLKINSKIDIFIIVTTADWIITERLSPSGGVS